MAMDTEALQRILAPNPSPLTGPGTTTFLLGHDHVAVIDPGPSIDSHVESILQAGGGRISHILVTHAHRDHSGAVPALREATGAPVLAFGDALAGRSAVMQQLAASGLGGGGEGMDLDFTPDHRIAHGQTIETPDWQLKALHTPGHSAGHLCFQWGETMFCGDLVMGWATTLISPPDGDLADFLRSLALLQALAPTRLLPTHGDPIDTPAARLAELAAHRRQRTAEIVAALRDGPARPAELAARIYRELPEAMLPAATRNVLAHLIALANLGAVGHDGPLSAEALFSLA
ncbi:MBL fold metallo-hydrolase [Paracoccus sp. TK19116]|uniref:MBL fold metallo-hydrolase n=1 Tax=Paracoccus albicereus TaxID=2922394 RepID=A0ABT1MMV9_9RHOB|nr:MBL fold metallo-hydrolase [Paracoccus albicereus]MCQ0969602.1 MBL fold metallo-hydrolase [Paracoccus albicereus]